ncbi:hypothetical protein HMPREF0813_01098 [Streptococcus anginosus F0211]|uniref:Uncharacterized protein n=1 Tax=Streptococcus anginosus F0211 TaxID=706437 RepID=E6J1H3_STRAP|nr:hypothetical protein HMPREF0813_01098 [Streptococcus anginosus F0211]ETS96873.1 hypothetical protein HMPREF1512_0910 [Streptococcus sp. OBRC6]EWC98423.1 hypothetical protein HMPREF1509_0381 [Streptococcus sp. AC15]
MASDKQKIKVVLFCSYRVNLSQTHDFRMTSNFNATAIAQNKAPF